MVPCLNPAFRYVNLKFVCKTKCLVWFSLHQTLGTPHAWPNVLGVLHYLAQRAMTVCIHDGEMISHCFPNTDENGFQKEFGESEGKIIYETNIDCYQAFLNGDDEEQMDRFLTDYQDRLLVLGPF